MSLIICPECKKQFSESADACPHCGYKISAETKEIIKKADKSSSKIVWISLLVIVVITIMIRQCNKETTPEKPWYEEDNSLMAYIMTEDWVKQKLKSPSTADFADGAIKSEHVTNLGNQKYRIVSWVDSQNSFGATIRTHFVAEVENHEKDMWRLISLEFTE